MNDSQEIKGIIAVLVIGLVIAIGKLLESDEQLTWRVAIGRAITTMGLALGAFAMLAWIPDANIYLIVGVSALLASFGTSGIVALVHRLVGRKS